MVGLTETITKKYGKRYVCLYRRTNRNHKTLIKMASGMYGWTNGNHKTLNYMASVMYVMYGRNNGHHEKQYGKHYDGVRLYTLKVSLLYLSSGGQRYR